MGEIVLYKNSSSEGNITVSLEASFQDPEDRFGDFDHPIWKKRLGKIMAEASETAWSEAVPELQEFLAGIGQPFDGESTTTSDSASVTINKLGFVLDYTVVIDGYVVDKEVVTALIGAKMAPVVTQALRYFRKEEKDWASDEIRGLIASFAAPDHPEVPDPESAEAPQSGPEATNVVTIGDETTPEGPETEVIDDQLPEPDSDQEPDLARELAIQVGGDDDEVAASIERLRDSHCDDQPTADSDEPLATDGELTVVDSQPSELDSIQEPIQEPLVLHEPEDQSVPEPDDDPASAEPSEAHWSGADTIEMPAITGPTDDPLDLEAAPLAPEPDQPADLPAGFGDHPTVGARVWSPELGKWLPVEPAHEPAAEAGPWYDDDEIGLADDPSEQEPELADDSQDDPADLPVLEPVLAIYTGHIEEPESKPVSKPRRWWQLRRQHQPNTT